MSPRFHVKRGVKIGLDEAKRLLQEYHGFGLDSTDPRNRHNLDEARRNRYERLQTLYG